MYKKISKCRICGSRDLELAIDLGIQKLTGVFPKHRNDKLTKGPLRLVKCSGKNKTCGLLQLEHSYDISEMYGENYGYRSGLNASMVAHLQNKVSDIESRVQLSSGDLIIDIGSNDCTTLKAYNYSVDLVLVGVDPTGIKFKEFYPSHVKLIPDFFNADLITSEFPNKRAKVITSFSMFYDLESPLDFMKEVHSVLADDGVWIFEQSYLPFMLNTNSFDTICHEHIEFYSMKQIQWMCDEVGFKIVDVEFNEINGGSFSVMVSKKESPLDPSDNVRLAFEKEIGFDLDSIRTYLNFSKRIDKLRNEMHDFIKKIKSENKTISAIGASTKGNVLLQYYGLDSEILDYIGEVNELKFNCFTPGSLISIISEEKVLDRNPDYLLILPWHFRTFFLNNKKFKGYKLVFPLPALEIVDNV